MEKSGQLVWRVMAVFNAVTGANLDPELQKVRSIEAPKLAALDDAIYLNPKLFERVAAIYNQRLSLALDPESLRLVEFDYKKFVHSGRKALRRRQGRTEKAERRGIDSFQCVLATNCSLQPRTRRTNHRSGRTFGAERRANRVYRASSQGPQV